MASSQSNSKQQNRAAAASSTRDLTCQPFWPFQHRTIQYLGAAGKARKRSPNHLTRLTLNEPALETTRDRSVC